MVSPPLSLFTVDFKIASWKQSSKLVNKLVVQNESRTVSFTQVWLLIL